METDESTVESAVDSATLDEAFRALSDATRRRLLAYLVAREEPVAFDELVEHLSTAVHRDEPGGRDDIRVALYHVHIPLLASAGLVDFDEARELVSSTERLQRVIPLLDRLGASE